MDILDLLDNNTLKLINSSSSYTFQGKKYFYFDRDYTDDFKNALYYWENDNKYCLEKYGHITFWDTSEIQRQKIKPKDIDEILLWKST